MKIGQHKTHPAADVLPLIEGEEFEAFCRDIKANGQRDEIVLFSGLVLDGRNRYRACLEVGIKPRFTTLAAGVDPIGYVESKNVARRHLSASQRAYAAAKLAQLRSGQRADRAAAAASAGGKKSAAPASKPLSQPAAAQKLKVSERAVRSARVVLEKGAPEVQRAVERGELAVDAAAKLAERPKAEQVALMKRAHKPGKEMRSGYVRSIVAQEKKREIVAKVNRVEPLPEGPFGLIYGDYPWPYDNSDQHEGSRGQIGYPPMPMAAILAHAADVAKRAAKDCVVALWFTNAFLDEIGPVLKAYGAKLRSAWTWDKETVNGHDKLGIGTWGRGRTEHLVIASIGNPVHTLNEVLTLIRAKVREHSRKPDEFAELLAKHCAGPRLELFAREPREGWVVWGAESNGAKALVKNPTASLAEPEQLAIAATPPPSVVPAPSVADADAARGRVVAGGDRRDLVRVGPDGTWCVVVDRLTGGKRDPKGNMIKDNAAVTACGDRVYVTTDGYDSIYSAPLLPAGHPGSGLRDVRCPIKTARGIELDSAHLCTACAFAINPHKNDVAAAGEELAARAKKNGHKPGCTFEQQLEQGVAAIAGQQAELDTITEDLLMRESGLRNGDQNVAWKRHPEFWEAEIWGEIAKSTRDRAAANLRVSEFVVETRDEDQPGRYRASYFLEVHGRVKSTPAATPACTFADDYKAVTGKDLPEAAPKPAKRTPQTWKALLEPLHVSAPDSERAAKNRAVMATITMAEVKEVAGEADWKLKHDGAFAPCYRAVFRDKKTYDAVFPKLSAHGFATGSQYKGPKGFIEIIGRNKAPPDRAKATRHADLGAGLAVHAREMAALAKRPAPAQAPYGFDVEYVTHTGETKLAHKRGTESAARKHAMMQKLAARVISTTPLSEDAFIRAYGHGRGI